MATYGQIKFGVDKINEILDKADKASSGGIPVVQVSGPTPTQELQPNTYYKFEEVTQLNLTFADGNEGVCNEYMFEFTASGDSTTLSLPSEVKWVGDTPNIEPKKTYQVSILNNIAIIAGVSFLYKVNISLSTSGFVTDKVFINGQEINQSDVEVQGFLLEYKIGDTLNISFEKGFLSSSTTVILEYIYQSEEKFMDSNVETTIKSELRGISITINAGGSGGGGIN